MTACHQWISLTISFYSTYSHLSSVTYTSSYLYHYHFTLTLLLFNLTTFLHSHSSYILVATFILYYNILLFSSLLVHELTSYNSVLYIQVYHKHHLLRRSSSSYKIYTIIIPHHITTLISHTSINIILWQLASDGLQTLTCI
jgi:hypothetical protein